MAEVEAAPKRKVEHGATDALALHFFRNGEPTDERCGRVLVTKVSANLA
jgi:hypothetical protein